MITTIHLKLDQACIKKGKAPPLLTAYEYMIAHLLDKADNFENKDINEMLVKIYNIAWKAYRTS